MTGFAVGERVTVLREAGVIVEVGEGGRAGWYLVAFPERTRWPTGWVAEADIRRAA